MTRYLHIILVPFLALSGRSLIHGANIGDALALFVLAGAYCFTLFLRSKEEAPINDDVKREVAELRSAVNAFKVGKAFGNR